MEKLLVLKLKRPKTHPSLTFLTITSDFEYFSSTIPIYLLIPDSLTGRTSKTEFVCKSYGQLKFAAKNFPKQRDRGGVAGLAPTSPPFFLTENLVRRGVAGSAPRPLFFFFLFFFFTDGTGKETLSQVVAAVMRLGVAVVDGCGGDDYGGDAETSGGGG
jgi:hypothetical protein